MNNYQKLLICQWIILIQSILSFTEFVMNNSLIINLMCTILKLQGCHMPKMSFNSAFIFPVSTACDDLGFGK